MASHDTNPVATPCCDVQHGDGIGGVNISVSVPSKRSKIRKYIMLTIRKEQMRAFQRSALHNFENDMAVHLQQFAPRYCEAMGDMELRSLIQSGITRSREYGLTERGPVRFFLEQMFLLGIDFDTDPQLPWVLEILKNPNMPDQMARSNFLYDHTLDYVNAVGGKDYEYIKEALRKLAFLRFEDFPDSKQDFDYDVLSRLKTLYPQKYQHVGEQALRSLVTLGVEKSKKHALTTCPGISLYIALMFAFGHGFDHDPRIPWALNILKDPDLRNPTDKAKSLYQGMMGYFSEMLADLEKRENLCVYVGATGRNRRKEPSGPGR